MARSASSASSVSLPPCLPTRVTRRGFVPIRTLDLLLATCSSELIVQFIELDECARVGVPSQRDFVCARSRGASLVALLPLPTLEYLSAFCFEAVNTISKVMPGVSANSLKFAVYARMLATLMPSLKPRMMAVDFDVLDPSVWSVREAVANHHPVRLEDEDRDVLPYAGSGCSAPAFVAVPGSPLARRRAGAAKSGGPGGSVLPFGSPLHPGPRGGASCEAEDEEYCRTVASACTAPGALDSMLSAMMSYDADMAFL